MNLRLVLVLLCIGLPLLAQTRERGKFSLQGDKATLMAIDPEPKATLFAFSTGAICVFPTEQRVVNVYAHGAHKKAITGAAFLPDSSRFVTCSLDGTIRVWDTAASLKHRKTMEDSNGDIKPENPKPLLEAKGPVFSCLAIDPEGKLLATGSTDGSLRLWDVESLKAVSIAAGAHPGGVKSVQFSPDGRQLATGGADKACKVWKVAEGKATVLRKLDGHEGAVNCVVFHPEGKLLATASGLAKKSGSVRVWDLEAGKQEYRLEEPEDVTTSVVFHPRTAHLATGSMDGKIRIWDLEEKRVLYTDEHSEPIRNLVISSNGVRFGSCSDRTVRWWASFGESN